MTEEVDAIELFYKALEELKADPSEKINSNRVAQKAGRSNSNIYKKTSRHIQLQRDIKAAQEIRDKDLKIEKLEAEIRKLTRQLTNAKKKVEELMNKEKLNKRDLVRIAKLSDEVKDICETMDWRYQNRDFEFELDTHVLEHIGFADKPNVKLSGIMFCPHTESEWVYLYFTGCITYGHHW